MNESLFFSAESLDDVSPNYFQIGNIPVAIEDEAKRRAITNLIFKIAETGKILWRNQGAELFVARTGVDTRFLIQVYSEELDRAGRRAPILCSGKIDDQDEPAKQIFVGITETISFAKEIGRNVDSLHLEAFRSQEFERKLNRWADTFKKRQQTIKIAIGIGIIALVTVVTVAEIRQSKQINSKSPPKLAPSTPNTAQEG